MSLIDYNVLEYTVNRPVQVLLSPAPDRLGPQFIERLVELCKGGNVSLFLESDPCVSTPDRWP